VAEKRPARESLPLSAPVVEVTVLEDRARVVRRGRVRLEAGLQRVQVSDVAPVLSDATLSVTPEPGGSGLAVRVVDCRVLRRLVPRSPGGEEPESQGERLEAERERLDRELAKLDAERTLAAQQAGTLLCLAELALTEITEDVTWGRAEPGAWADRLEALDQRSDVAQRRLVDLLHDSDKKRRARDRLHERIQALRNPSSEEWAGVEADLAVEEPGECTLRFEYVVPGACWRPHHTARLLEGPTSRVEFRTEGSVWQNTGEDWTDVRLLFSTQRPSLGTDPPTLTSDLLRVRGKPEDVVVEAREQTVATTGLGQAQGGTSVQLPGIDDGGEVVSLTTEAPASVPTDGRPCRIPLSCFQAEAETSLVALPELVSAVLLKSTQPNAGSSPILAGPVDLIRSGGHAGRTSVLFVAPGERFSIGWGPELELRVQRDVEVGEDTQKLLSSWESRQHRVAVRLSNIGPGHRTVEVTERIPVSEIDKVTIVPDEERTTERRRPDADGFVSWTVQLRPFRHERRELRYTLKKHGDVKGI
jgi:uncharacterized protein (TIGR02231 family)